MAFNGYQASTMNSPLQVASGGMLVLPDISALGAPRIVLEWPFLNPSAAYPFSNTLYIPVTNTTNGTLTVVLPDTQYASFPQTIIVLNQSANQTVVFIDSLGLSVCTIFPLGSFNGSTNGMIILTNNGLNQTGTSYWQFIPVSGTPYPTPASTYAGLGLVPDTYYQRQNLTGPLFNPNIIVVTETASSSDPVNLALSPYVYNFTAQPITISLSYNNVAGGSGNAPIFQLTGIAGDGSVQTERFDLSASLASSVITTNSYMSVISVIVTQLNSSAPPQAPLMTFQATLSGITGGPSPLDTTQPVTVLSSVNSTAKLGYADRNSVIVAPLSSPANTTYSVTLPDMPALITATTNPLPVSLANGFVLSFANQSIQNFTIEVANSDTTTIDVDLAAYVLPPDTSISMVYNPSSGGASGDWVLLAPYAPYAPTIGGLGASFTNLQPGQILVTNSATSPITSFTTFQALPNQLFYWNGAAFTSIVSPTTSPDSGKAWCLVYNVSGSTLSYMQIVIN